MECGDASHRCGFRFIGPLSTCARGRSLARAAGITRPGVEACSIRIVCGVRAALEVRHPSWIEELCLDTLRRFNIALALTDWPTLNVTNPLTADFVFVRRHGPRGSTHRII